MRVIDRICAVLDILVVPSVCILLGANYAPNLIVAVVLHELAHIAVIKSTGGQILGFAPAGIGLRISYSNFEMTYSQTLMATFAGSTVNILLAIGACVFRKYDFAAVNFALGFFNLLPVSGLDGREVLEIICTAHAENGALFGIVRACSLGAAFVLWLSALYVQFHIAPMPEMLVVSVALLLRELVS